MSQDNDGVNDVINGGLRVALTAAGQVGERLAREREQAARQARAVADADAREAQDRFSAQRAAARAQLAPVERDVWWETATNKQITDALEVAVAWQAIDPQAAAAGTAIARQVRQRFGVSVEQLASRPDRTGIVAGEPGRDGGRPQAAAEQLEARRIIGDASEGQGAVVGGVVPKYDSPIRRQERTERLVAQRQDPDAVSAVMLSDMSQAHPAREALATPAAEGALASAALRQGRHAELGR